MSIPPILLAIALMALTRGSVQNVIIAITHRRVPARRAPGARRRAVSLREQPYVEAAIASGTRLPVIIWRHILPNTLAPLMVQATYICASAMITEAILSLHRRRHAADHPELGQHHGRGPRAVAGEALHRVLPGGVPVDHRAGGEHAGRRAARRARSAPGEAAVRDGACSKSRTCRRISARRDGVVRAVEGLSFHIDAGETLGIVGESGCGKSVTSMSILRLVPEPPGRIAGAIRFEGRDLLRAARARDARDARQRRSR